MQLIARAYPYIAKRLLTDEAEELRGALEEFLIKDGSFRSMHTSLCLAFKSVVFFHFSCNKPQLHCTQLLRNYFSQDATTDSVCSSYYFVSVVVVDFLFFCY